MYKVSVIVPVYNVEQYLQRCLESVVTQTLEELQIIVVNDGTKDHSQDIIDTFVAKYPKRVFAYQKENGGLSSARNEGLQYATGEYVAFLDSDDYIEKDMYQDMYNKAKEKHFDLVVCDFNEIREGKPVPFTSRIVKDLHSREEVKKAMVDFYPSAWNKLYKRSVLQDNHLLFKKGVWFEDVEFLYRLLPHITSVGCVAKPFYQYVIREGSITSRNDMRIYHYIDNWNGVVQYYKDMQLFDVYKEELEYCYVRYLFATFIKSATKFDRQEFSKATTKALQAVREHFPNYKKNAYLQGRSPKVLYLRYFSPFIASIIYLKLHP